MEIKEQFPPICPMATLATWKAAFLLERTTRNITNIPLMITSINDGTHRIGSRHYDGLAMDFRTHDFDLETKQTMAKLGNAELNKIGYRCFIEDLGLPNEHLHMEKI